MKVLRLFFWRRAGTRVSLIFLGIMSGLVLFFLIYQRSSPTIFELAWLLLPLMTAVYIFFIQPSRIAQQAAQVERLVAETTWEVSDSGVQITTRFGSSLIEWDLFERLVRSRDYYLLISKPHKNNFRFLPCRAFLSTQQQSRFLELVDKNLHHSGNQ